MIIQEKYFPTLVSCSSFAFFKTDYQEYLLQLSMRAKVAPNKQLTLLQLAVQLLQTPPKQKLKQIRFPRCEAFVVKLNYFLPMGFPQNEEF